MNYIKNSEFYVKFSVNRGKMSKTHFFALSTFANIVLENDVVDNKCFHCLGQCVLKVSEDIFWKSQRICFESQRTCFDSLRQRILKISGNVFWKFRATCLEVLYRRSNVTWKRSEDGPAFTFQKPRKMLPAFTASSVQIASWLLDNLQMKEECRSAVVRPVKGIRVWADRVNENVIVRLLNADQGTE